MRPHRVSDDISDSRSLAEIAAEIEEQDRRFLDAEFEYESCADGDA